MVRMTAKEKYNLHKGLSEQEFNILTTTHMEGKEYATTNTKTIPQC